jgi:flagellar biosynthesis GTPase FlhF
MKLITEFKLLCLAAALACSAGLTAAFATEVFTWTDEDGIVHYSDLPPGDSDARQIDVQDVYKPGTVESPDPASQSQAEPGQPPQSAAQQRRERMSKEREERREAQAETDRMCALHRQRLEQMEPARRVFYTDEAGESVRMDDDRRMGLIEESKEFIAKNCE